MISLYSRMHTSNSDSNNLIMNCSSVTVIGGYFRFAKDWSYEKNLCYGNTDIELGTATSKEKKIESN